MLRRYRSERPGVGHNPIPQREFSDPCQTMIGLRSHGHSDLKPQRVPLNTKRTKRCPLCKHILSKPEAKSTSIKYRIKMVASNYLPAIQLYRRPLVSLGSRTSAASSAAALRRGPRASVNASATGLAGEDDPLRPGRTFGFELAFINPLFEPIHVKLALAKPPSDDDKATTPFAFSLPATSFPIAAFAEQWEYEDAEDELEEDVESRRRSVAGGAGSSAKRRHAVGIVEKRANRTTVLLELNVGKDYVGPVQVRLHFILVSLLTDTLIIGPSSHYLYLLCRRCQHSRERQQ